MSGRPVPVALELGLEDRQAPVFFVFRRRRGRDTPACLACAWRRLGGGPQENGSNATRLGRKREPPRGGEIENLRLTGNLQKDRSEVRAGESFEPGPQRVGRVGCAHQKKARGMDAEFQKSGRGNLALFEGRKVLTDPEKVFLLRFMLQASLQHKCSKTDRSSTIRLARKHLVQCAEPQPTPKTSIRLGMTKRGKSPTMCPCKPNLFERAFEGGQLFDMA